MTASSWPVVLTELLVEKKSTPAHIRWAMEQLMSGAASPSQIAAFVVALRSKGESAQDVATLVDVMLEHALPADVPGTTVDTCGTGGDGAHTVNISTMAAIVAAAAGATVVKHGNRAASSKCGSADVLEQLGVRLDLPTPAVSEIAKSIGITFYFAQAFHPALKHAGPTRREIGIPTVFNFLGPLANPARPTAQVIGVAQPAVAPLMANVLDRRGTKALVVRGTDGLDELSTHAPSVVWAVLGDGITESLIDPAALGIADPPADALAGGDAVFNAAVVTDLFEGKRSTKLDAVRDAVCLNAAAALVAVDAVDSHITDVPKAIAARFADAVEVVSSGKALAKLDQWVALSGSFAEAE